MLKRPKTVGIIGAGPSGLVAAKSCLEEGLDPVILEAGPEIGGLWRGGGAGHAWEGMRTNLSKWSCMFSDFPWPGHAATFPTQADVLGYLKGYHDHFGLKGRILFNTRVAKSAQTEKGWDLYTDDGCTFHSDKVIIAAGFFAQPRVPEIPGIRNFSGHVLHSSEFGNPEHHHGKTVAIIGGSFSGCEIAAELAKRGTKVTHIMRTPLWILSRELNKTPIDLAFYNRKKKPEIRSQWERNAVTARFFEASFGNPGESHPDLRINPDSGNPNFSAVSDSYLDLVRSGQIAVQVSDVAGMTQGSVLLGNKESVEADTLILATGYTSNIDFLPGDIKQELAYDPADTFMPALLHKATMPEKNDGIGFVGFYRGPYFGVMELQARWLAAVMGGRLPAPSPEERAGGIEASRLLRNQIPRPQFPHSNYVEFADSFARLAGVMPDLAPDDPLHTSISEGPVIPSHYRLQGPHANRKIAESVIASLPMQGLKQP